MPEQDLNQAVENDTPQFDVNDLTVEEQREFISTGVMPEKKVEEAKAEPVKEEAPKEEVVEVDEGDKGVEEPKEEPKPETPTEEPFKFTEDADDETFAKEREAYLATVEITPELQTIIDRQNKQLEAFTAEKTKIAELGELDTVERSVKALNQLANYRKNEAGEFVPDTTALAELLQTEFAKELPQIVQDIAALPSQKYQGTPMFVEFIKDYFQLEDAGMKELFTFLNTGGKTAFPSFVPEGIDTRVSDAFWQSVDRIEIEDSLEANRSILADTMATQEEKQLAQNAIKAINARLAQVQAGIEATKAQTARTQADAARQAETLNANAAKNYVDTSVSLLREFSEKTAKNLTFLDDKGASMTALAYTTLVEKALTDDEFSKYAQEDLAKHGITFDWKSGRAVLDRLYDVEYKIVQQEAQGMNSRAIEQSRREKANILREIKGLETQLMGTLTKAVVQGSNKALETKVAEAEAKKSPAVRPKVQAKETAPAAQPTDIDYSKMSPEEIRSRIGELVHQRSAA